MKLIIDISDITYDSIMARDWKNAGWLFSEELKAIYDGTPLPKRHGRLFDERDIIKGGYKIIGNRIYELEPIVEADMESEE